MRMDCSHFIYIYIICIVNWKCQGNEFISLPLLLNSSVKFLLIFCCCCFFVFFFYSVTPELPVQTSVFQNSTITNRKNYYYVYEKKNINMRELPQALSTAFIEPILYGRLFHTKRALFDFLFLYAIVLYCFLPLDFIFLSYSLSL